MLRGTDLRCQQGMKSGMEFGIQSWLRGQAQRLYAGCAVEHLNVF